MSQMFATGSKVNFQKITCSKDTLKMNVHVDLKLIFFYPAGKQGLVSPEDITCINVDSVQNRKCVQPRQGHFSWSVSFLKADLVITML